MLIIQLLRCFYDFADQEEIQEIHKIRRLRF